MEKKKEDPHRKIRPSMNALVKEAGLKWTVVWLCGGHWNVTCSIMSDAVQRRHQIEVYPEAHKEWDYWKTQVGHEVCHGWLAENVDPAFACMRFSRAHGELRGADQVEFGRRAKLAYLAYILVDVWVNQVRHHFWPAMTAVDNASFTATLNKTARKGRLSEVAKDPNLMIALAQDIAERSRLAQAAADYVAVLAGLGEQAAAAVQELAQFYIALPQLSYQRDADIEKLRAAVAGAAQLLALPFQSELVIEDDTWVWKVMD